MVFHYYRGYVNGSAALGGTPILISKAMDITQLHLAEKRASKVCHRHPTALSHTLINRVNGHQ